MGAERQLEIGGMASLGITNPWYKRLGARLHGKRLPKFEPWDPVDLMDLIKWLSSPVNKEDWAIHEICSALDKPNPIIASLMDGKE